MQKITAGILLLFWLSAASLFAEQTTIQTNTNTSFLQDYYEQENATADKVKKISAPNPIWTTIKIILYTGILGVGAYFIIRYVITKGTIPSTADAKLVETILNKSLGMGSYLQIVKVGATYYLLGVSGDGVRLIDKITDQETIDFIELNKDSMKPKETRFVDILKFLPISKQLDKFDFLKNQKDRLKKL